VIRGGNATIYVSDLERAVEFYRDTLELRLVFRAGDLIVLSPGAITDAPGWLRCAELAHPRRRSCAVRSSSA
jgi:catechol 2,3-dioxygenase-like lactoylglutathione lyase family enzyme